MDRDKQREIASKGGRAAHLKGTAHRWTEEEAKQAGRKGGAASHRNGHRTAVKDRRKRSARRDSVGTEERAATESTEETTAMRNGG
jgi:general stress protein YciG